MRPLQPNQEISSRKTSNVVFRPSQPHLLEVPAFAEHEVGEKIEDRAEDKICEQGQEHGTVEKLGDGVRSLTDDPIDDDHAAA